jgi:hypothetical protein
LQVVVVEVSHMSPEERSQQVITAREIGR